jgi:hypothetical protein
MSTTSNPPDPSELSADETNDQNCCAQHEGAFALKYHKRMEHQTTTVATYEDGVKICVERNQDSYFYCPFCEACYKDPQKFNV